MWVMMSTLNGPGTLVTRRSTTVSSRSPRVCATITSAPADTLSAIAGTAVDNSNTNGSPATTARRRTATRRPVIITPNAMNTVRRNRHRRWGHGSPARGTGVDTRARSPDHRRCDTQRQTDPADDGRR